MPSPSKEPSHSLSSPTPARPRINVAGYRYSDTDSDDDGDNAGRWNKGKRGVIGIAEARGGKSAGFFGGGEGLNQGRRRRRVRGSSSSEVEEVVEIDAVVGRGGKRGQNKDKGGVVVVVDDEEDEDERLKREIRERKVKRRFGSVAVVSGSAGVASSQPASGKKVVGESESEEGAESTEERNLKDWIRAKRERARGARNRVNGGVDVKRVSMEDRKGKEMGKGKEMRSGDKKKNLSDDEGEIGETVKVAPPPKPRGRRGWQVGDERGAREVYDVEVDEARTTSKRKTRNCSSDATSAAPKHDQNEKRNKRARVSPEGGESSEGEDAVRPTEKRGKFRHLPIVNGKKEEQEEAEAAVRQCTGGEVPLDSEIQATQVMRDKAKGWLVESDHDGGEDEGPDDPDLGSQVPARLMEKKGRGRRGRKVVVDDDDEFEGNIGDEDKGEKFVHFEAGESNHEESDEPIPKRQTRSGKGRKLPILDSIDGNDDPLVVTSPGRRRLKSAGKPSLVVMAEDDSDLGSDVELAAQTPVMKSRLRYGDSPKKLTPFQKKLKELKAKRQGVDLALGEEEEEVARWGKALYDSDTSGTGGSVLDDVDDEQEGEGALVAKSRRRDGGLDSDIESFIVTDDESDPLGAPDDEGTVGEPKARIPIQFTSQSHASLKNHFKTVVQYMLNLLLNPSFPKDDQYFTYALHSVDRKVDSFRDSVLKSEAWRSDFMRALKSRPGFEFDPEGGHGLEDHCMACNRRDRNASYTVRFTGKRYNPDNFSDYESDSGDSEDEAGNIIPPSAHPFPVGRYCYERAEITHSFWHWKKGLRTALEEVLTQMGVFEEEVVRKLDRMKGKERWRWVDAKLGELERGGDVDLLWDMFQAQMKRAEEFMSNPRRYYAK